MSLSDENFERLKARRSNQQPLKIQYPKITPIFFVLLALGILLLLWSFLGRIPTEISGSGVVMSKSGTFVVSSSGQGTVTALYVTEGDTVKPGIPLALIYNPEIKSLLTQIEALRYKICQQKAELVLLISTYETNQQLFREGLIAKIVLDNSKSQVHEKNIEIDESLASRDAKISNLLAISSASKNTVIAVEEELKQYPGKIDLDRLTALLSTLVAHEKGKVLEVLVNIGDRVDRKTPLIWIEHPLENKQKVIFYSTVKSDVIGNIRLGMKVLIEPANVNPQEYGSIIGNVKKIYPYPVSKEELMQTLGNQQIAQYLVGNEPAKTLLIIEPELSDKTPSGFVWTSAEGPPFTIPSGTLVSVKLVIDAQPPISYLIPLWKIKKPFQELDRSPKK